MTKTPENFEIEAPSADRLTPYDEAHLALYLRILDAHAGGASLDEIAGSVLGIDPARDPVLARRAASSHLRRAQWMTTHGYRFLLE